MSGLLEAVRVGDLVKMQRLLREGASILEVDGLGRTALANAVIDNYTHVVKWLLRTGGAQISDVVDTHGMTTLALAAGRGRFSLVQWLLEEGGANITDVIIFAGKSESLWYVVI
jgi:ankyrin repeat protein